MVRDALRPILVALVSIGAAFSSARGNTIIVDVNGSGQFTDIPPAIAAAQDGDTLLVLPGAYSGFTLDKDLFIIGYGDARAGDASVSLLYHGFAVAVVNLRLTSFSVSSCQDTVIAQELTGLQSLDVAWSTDVRIRSASVQQPVGNPLSYAVTTQGSRVELVASTVHGSEAPDCASYANGGDGWSISDGSRVHAARSYVLGGSGSLCATSLSFHGGDGAPAIELSAPGQLILAGGGVGYVDGGVGGFNFAYQDCSHDGNDACSITTLSGTSLWYSGVFISSGSYVCQPMHCLYCPIPPICGPAVAVSPDDPTLDVSGEPVAGQTIRFTVYAPPGSSAILYFGRQAIIVPDADPSVVEQLTPKARIVNLGTIPTSGQAQFAWPIHAGLQPGTLLIAQSEITLAGGAIRRTNSIPVIVR
jgi:hypothetical protein